MDDFVIVHCILLRQLALKIMLMSALVSSLWLKIHIGSVLVLHFVSSEELTTAVIRFSLLLNGFLSQLPLVHLQHSRAALLVLKRLVDEYIDCVI